MYEYIIIHDLDKIINDNKWFKSVFLKMNFWIYFIMIYKYLYIKITIYIYK